MPYRMRGVILRCAGPWPVDGFERAAAEPGLRRGVMAMAKVPIKAFVPPTRARPKPKEDEFSEPVWKWVKVLAWLVFAAVVINALLWLLSKGF